MGAARFDDSDDLQIFGPPPGSNIEALVATGADGAIDEDLYCLTCGYNLRGLSGDPVRCPECGGYNNLGIVTLPASYIRRAHREMETLPTLCVAQVAGFVLSLLFTMVVWPGNLIPILIGVGFIGAWFFTRSRVRRSFDNQPGWGGILRDFHYATLLCTALIPLFFTSLYLGLELRVVPLGPAILLSLILAASAFILGLRIYHAARQRMDVMQREAAVRIAKEHLRRSLQGPKQRQTD